ncbi:snurportin-1-like [Elysia marginata]|uniref:Snurportin-1 n=1 Tax=Elysia marginata TaxID=1093978 RepID=A0AAV4HFH7_9GAST|nr:snurportin-1-like [Elysia marginata]
MEELTAALASSFEVSNDPNKTSAPHPRYSQYKQKASKSDQETRRKQLLEIQKNRRYDFMNLVRNLTDNDWSKSDGGLSKDNTQEEEMETETELKKPGRFYKDQLMLSEWLVEVPNDFASEWITVLCPVAKRCLVVASRSTTKAYTKSGYCITSFPSHLPGGNRKGHYRDSTILDCLYNEATKTFYILDLMCWNGHTVYDSETEFRFYWLYEKLQEFPELSQASKINPYIFVGLPSFRCTQEDIASAVNAATFEIDGVLFFHKRTHYTFGSTPLVVWLKPYMLEEILGIAVSEGQKSHKPAGYTNYANHMKQVEEDRLRFEKEKQMRLQSGASRGGRGRGRGGSRGGKHQRNKAMDTSQHGENGQGAGNNMEASDLNINHEVQRATEIQFSSTQESIEISNVMEEHSLQAKS